MSQLVCHCIKEYLGNLVDLFNFHTRTVDSIITEHSLYFLDHLETIFSPSKDYEKIVLTVMVNNSTNINKMKKHLSPKHKQDHDIWHWKSRSCLGQAYNVVVFNRLIIHTQNFCDWSMFVKSNCSIIYGQGGPSHKPEQNS
jgi:hypothetical protein